MEAVIININYSNVEEIYKPIINDILFLVKSENINELHKFVDNMDKFDYGFILALYYIGMLGVEEGTTKEDYLNQNIEHLMNINRQYCKFFEARYDILKNNLESGLIIFSKQSVK